MGVGGLALSTACASWVNMICLYIMLRRKIGLLGGRRILVTMMKSLIGCAGMVVFCLLIMRTGKIPALPLIVRLTVAIAGGVAIYMAIARLLQMEEWVPFWAQLSRSRPAEIIE